VKHQRPIIAPEDRVPFWRKVAYGAGSPVDWLTVGLATTMLWMPIFNIGYGIRPGILGLILVVYRIWDAVSDPVMGNISDNTRTRWGRRRPYVLVGAVLTGVLMPLLWRLPTQWGETGMIIYITALGLLIFTSFTMWGMPYYSLMLEMTPNYDERTRCAAFRTFFTQCSILLGGWVLAVAASKQFANPVTGEADIANGMRTISLWLAGLVIILGILPAVFVKERYYEKESKKQEKVTLLKGLKETVSIKPLWFLIGIVICQVVGTGIAGKLGQYINIYYISGGELGKASMLEGWKASVGFIAGVSAIFFWTWVCERLDKKWALMIILGSGFIGAVLNFVCLTPKHPYLQLIPNIFFAGVIGALWMIIPSMQADIVDFDEITTHKRREGSINSVFSWFLKIGMTAAVGFSGFVLEWTGFDVHAGKIQPADVVHNMLIWYILLPIVFWSIAILLLWRYPLTRGTMLNIRNQLEARRGKV
jgi:GPH family glycoside/pentoside/hexuronide:cation symporter